MPVVVSSVPRGGGGGDLVDDDDDDDECIDDDRRRRLEDALLRLADGIVRGLTMTTTISGSGSSGGGGRAMIVMPTLHVAFDGLLPHLHDDRDDRDNRDDRDYRDDGMGRHNTEETKWTSYSRRFLEVAFRRIWEERFGGRISTKTTRTTTTEEEEGTMTGSVMETTAVVGAMGETSSSSLSISKQSSRYVVEIDVSRGAIYVTTTIDGQMTITNDDDAAVDVTGSMAFGELCKDVRLEMRRCRSRRPRPTAPMEDEARACSFSSSSDDCNIHASIVANECGGAGEDGTMADGVLLPTTATVTVDRADRRSATMQHQLPPQTTTTTTTTSEKLRRELGSVMAEAIAVAEGRLMEMECEMDESSLAVGGYGDNDDDDDVVEDDDEGSIARGMPMQRFGDRVDVIVDALSLTFFAFVEENGDVMTESDQAWAEGEYATFFLSIVAQ